jgi:hypothetical protein
MQEVTISEAGEIIQKQIRVHLGAMAEQLLMILAMLGKTEVVIPILLAE